MAPDGSSNTAAVTGAAGHVGGALVRELLARGYRVRAMVSRDRRALKGLELDEVQGDITDPDSLDRLFDRDQVVYHLAALISLDGDANPRLHEINVEGTRNVVQACLRRGEDRRAGDQLQQSHRRAALREGGRQALQLRHRRVGAGSTGLRGLQWIPG